MLLLKKESIATTDKLKKENSFVRRRYKIPTHHTLQRLQSNGRQSKDDGSALSFIFLKNSFFIELTNPLKSTMKQTTTVINKRLNIVFIFFYFVI